MNGWLLGSGGGITSRARCTCSALLREGGHALLIDAGTGVGHLVQEPALVAGVDKLDIVLTHFHLDHLMGLSALPSVALAQRPTIYGPGRRLYGCDTRELLAKLLGRPFLAAGWDFPVIAADVLEIADTPLCLGPFHIASRVQTLHSDPTLAFRVNDRIAYCTDTEYDIENVGFASGCRVLVHEAWHTSAQPPARGHSSAAQAAQIARRAGVDSLYLIHINPIADEAALAQDGQAIFARTTVGCDLMALAST